ncbi:MAG: hypothetical protein A2Y17_00500 [Clostridiales bacterium GWF2_38_85]|nr:MAG: hypothetical protein A2Y17_00500 [Clostridiales bacterium GWF2_38_85]HBL83525.1 iron-sulfur protein [Clostridiales bacterium]
MKTLIFNGSPRANGDTTFLISELVSKLKGEVRIVNTYKSKIEPCSDCRYCWEKAGCCIDDEMQSVYKDIIKCDNIVIASPVYFSELTGSLLNVLSRLQCFYANRRFLGIQQIIKEKTGALILCGGGDGEPDKAEETGITLLKMIRARHIKTIFSLKTDTLSAKNDVKAINDIAGLADILNRYL